MEASELYEICRELAEGAPDSEATRQLHEVLKLCCAEGCRRQGGAFGNLFSQVDWLCKRLHLSPSQTRDLQDARRHTNAGAPVSASDWAYDIKAVARLVSAVFAVDIPSTLVPLLPADERPHMHGLRINKDYVRCIVSSITPESMKPPWPTRCSAASASRPCPSVPARTSTLTSSVSRLPSR